MALLLDSFWRAVAYCLHPRVIALSILPLLVMVAAALGLGWVFWDSAVDAVFQWLLSSSLMVRAGEWLQSMGMGSLRTVVAPLIVVLVATPAIVFGALLLVAALMTPALVKLVADRRFPLLERKHGASLAVSVGWALLSTAIAIVALVVSMPLWLIPPLVLLLPPLIWGWLTYRVMAFDALAEHADRDERRTVLERHRAALFGIGVVTGYLGAAPSLVWASGALFAAAFVILVPVAIWIYTVVFAFSSLWFTHFCLAALEQLRAEQRPPPPPMETVTQVPLALPDAHTS